MADDLGEGFCDSEAWLCTVGHYHEDGLHCPDTGEEPPWGCPCSLCQDGTDDEEDTYVGLDYDPYDFPWDGEDLSDD